MRQVSIILKWHTIKTHTRREVLRTVYIDVTGVSAVSRQQTSESGSHISSIHSITGCVSADVNIIAFSIPDPTGNQNLTVRLIASRFTDSRQSTLKLINRSVCSTLTIHA